MALKRSYRYYALVLLGGIIFFVLAAFLKDFKSTEINDMEIILTAQVLEDDVFQLFYWESPETEFKIKNSVRTKVKGADAFQDIHFTLPRIQDLFRLRLDIGENFNQKTITVKGIKFSVDGNEYKFGIEEFNSLFAANKHIAESSVAKFTGNPDTIKTRRIYDPYFVSVDGSKEMEQVRIKRLTRFPYLVSGLICLVGLLFIGYNMENITITQKGIFITMFILILFLPALEKELKLKGPMESMEKRVLAEKPEFTWSKQYARAYESYYNDNFGFRNTLINWGSSIRTKLFRTSMHPDVVMIGKKKWLFYNKMENSRIFMSYSRANLLSKDTLKIIVNKWENNKNEYEAEGRKYFLAFWPNKHSIYPEYLPSAMKSQIKDTLSRVDQIIQFINKSNSPVKLLDVRPVLLKAKNDQLLYHKFDTHWNDYGAFLAYKTFFSENKHDLGLEPKSLDDFEITWNDYTQGDLIQMLGVRNNGFFKEISPKFTLKENKDQIEFLSIDGYPKLTVRTRNEHCGNKLKALIFRDSFTNSLIQFFSLHFYEVTYIWGHKDYYVNKVQPDIIIDGYVERDIGEKGL